MIAVFRASIVAGLLLLCLPSVPGATFNIANGDVAGLISAINSANSNNQDDTINLAASGSYVVTAANSGQDGFPIIASDSGHSLAINGNGATISRSASAKFRFFHNNGNATISRLTVIGGATSASDVDGGGAIANAGGTLTVQFCTFSTNSLSNSAGLQNVGGGALYNTNGTLTVTGCTFSSNTVCFEASQIGSGGGAICNSSTNGTATATITSCTFGHNSAGACPPNGFGSNGGAILNMTAGGHQASITVNACTFDSNSSNSSGGAIQNSGGTATVTSSTFVQNSVAEPSFPLTAGGAMENRGGTATITNCTFTGNQANDSQGKGGAIHNYSASLTVTACTLSADSSTNGGEIYNEADSTSVAMVTVRDTILQTTHGGTLVNSGASASITSQGYNLSTDNGGGFLTATGDQINADPKLDPNGLQFNGYAVKTFALIYGSPAIDKGKSFGVTTDQRGVIRPQDNPGIPNVSGGDGSDIGAYEAPNNDALQGGPPYVVNTTADHDDGICGGADCTLREAINQANALQTNLPITITFSVLGTITLTSSPFELGINRSMTITGPTPRNLVIDGNNAHRIFDIAGGNVSISGVTIRNGNFITDSGLTRQGGAVYNTATSLSFSDCEFINNIVVGLAGTTNGDSGGSGQGGAIFSTSNLSLTRCTFLANTATGGAGHAFSSSTVFGAGGNGGAAQGGAVFSDPTGVLTITNCTFTNGMVTGGNGGSGNSGTFGASGGNADGGAICNLGAMTVTSATVSVNTGTGGSGAAFGFQRHGPNGTGNGGVADLTGSSGHVANTIIAGNSGTSAPDAEGTFISSGYNLIGISDQSTGFSGTTKDQIGTAAAPISPQLRGLGDNGGLTNTMLPLGTSPAVDQGNSFGFTTDQRGQPRPFDEPGIPNASDGSDIGAAETDTQLGPIFTVGTTADHDDGTCSVSDCTLREAINAANSASGPNTISFAPGLTGTITLEPGFGALSIASDTTIVGPGARTLAVSGNSGTRVFLVSGGTSTISGLAIRDGFAMVFPGNQGPGGAIFNSANLTLNDCTLTNNVGVGGRDNGSFGGAGGSVFGGAIYNSATLTLNRCTFSDNNLTGGNGGLNGDPSGTGGSGGAAQGAALYNDTNGILSINDCTLSGNTATGGPGGNGHIAGRGGDAAGGVFNVGAMTITAATVSGNAGTGGFPGGGSNPFFGRGIGGLASRGGTITAANTLVALNTGSNSGGIDVDGPFTSSGYNLVGTITHSTGFGTTGDQTGTDTSKVDPKIGPLQDNGGQTDTMMLLINSPALDKGKSFGLTFDQRGMLRTLDSPMFANASSGDGTDIGAVEFYPQNGADTDGDGMPDDFENFFGFNPNDPTDANLDADGDGLTNVQEFQAGTNPRDPSSTLRVTNIIPGGGVQITFSLAVVGKTYRLERKAAITDTIWNSINGVSDFTPAATGAAQITDPNPGATQGFYRVRIVP